MKEFLKRHVNSCQEKNYGIVKNISEIFKLLKNCCYFFIIQNILKEIKKVKNVKNYVKYGFCCQENVSFNFNLAPF